MQANVQLKSTILEIYSYVLAAQVKYCKFDMRHPFLESTYLNVAIFHRSDKRYSEALMMFKRLETLQKTFYGDKNICLLYTFKNIGVCQLALGNKNAAAQYF